MIPCQHKWFLGGMQQTQWRYHETFHMKLTIVGMCTKFNKSLTMNYFLYFNIIISMLVRKWIRKFPAEEYTENVKEAPWNTYSNNKYINDISKQDKVQVHIFFKNESASWNFCFPLPKTCNSLCKEIQCWFIGECIEKLSRTAFH
jgi:hypothetical protein